MDYDEAAINLDEMLNSASFPPQFDQLELDSLLYGTDESQESSSSSTFGFGDASGGFRSRDGGSLGDSSTDSSPPLSCANFTENDQELWDFGFQNQSPYGINFEQNQQFESPFPQEETISEPNNDYMRNHHYIDEETMNSESVPMPPKRIYAIVPKSQPQVKRIASRPIQKIYRLKEPENQNQQMQSYRVVQQMNSSKPSAQNHPNKKPVNYPFLEHLDEIPAQPSSGPLIRQVSNSSDERRFVPIAPTVDIKQEPQNFSPEQNRKIRNRMYAQASRIRKKEAEETLKQNLAELLQENEMLKNENIALKQRLSYYENEHNIMKAHVPTHGTRQHTQRKMIAAGTVLMMFGLFAVISPFSIMSIDQSIEPSTNLMVITNESVRLVHHGRVIGNEESTALTRKSNDDIHNFVSNSSHHDCDMYKLNATETLRVNNDIERWVQVHSFDDVPLKFSGGLLNKEAMRKFNEARKVAKKQGPQNAFDQKKSDQAALRSRERTWRQLDLLKTGNNIADNEKIQRKRQNIDRIASIVRQKGDTLYIMTLQDYVLLPSLKKGANSIPKLSLLLPSVPMNGTMLDQYSLLRVDCEVTGTGQLTLSNKQISFLMP